MSNQSKTTLTRLIQTLRSNQHFMEGIIDWTEIRARPAVSHPLPDDLDPRLTQSLLSSGYRSLYNHQALAYQHLAQQKNIVVATRTASGKSLCYTLPTLNRILENEQARALYIFPTKALAHDQLTTTQQLINAGNLPISVGPFDGDTPRHQRANIRASSQIIITNPDMLHASILPGHTQWRPFLQNLTYIVIDEIHTYKGIFGSHVANVIRRLLRICRFYKNEPLFVCCSATIANPLAHAEKLTEKPFLLIGENDNGAPRSSKSFLTYNPPLVDETIGLRKSTVLTAKDAAALFVMHDVQTAVFARARNTVELLLGYLRDELSYNNDTWNPEQIAGYRGGYLPLERQKIEYGLRSGEIRGVVATNALELGVDIGQLDGVIMTGYPGSIASVWQQSGRAGRREKHAIALLILSNSPLDQYIANHPDFLFGRSPENALINPDNLRMLAKHLTCAAFELPLRPDEVVGQLGPLEEILDAMVEMGLLHRTNNQYHYLADGEIPHHKFSLRTSGSESVVIQTNAGPESRARVIGEVDLESAGQMVFSGAVYAHQGETFMVDMLDWDNRVAHVTPFQSDFYTRASVASQLQEMAPMEETTDKGAHGSVLRAWGEILIVTKATGFRKIKRYSHETLGFGQIDLPEIPLDTNAYWFLFDQNLSDLLFSEGILLPPNDYGPTWQKQRKLALERDDHTCQLCRASGTLLHVHHIKPFREFGYIRGENRRDEVANRVENLITVCPSCHQRAESGQQTRSGLSGLAYALRNLAPLFLMCDPSDIQVLAESHNTLMAAPTIVIYEQVPAGIGFSEKLFEIHAELLQAVADRISRCICLEGCPACVGPPADIGPNTKESTSRLLHFITT